MATITTIASTDTLAASRSTLNSNFAALQNIFASATAPTSPVAYQLWWDTTSATAPVLKVRDSTNASWITLLPNGGAANAALLPLSGGTMTGTLAMGSQAITGLPAAAVGDSPCTKTQADARVRVATIPIGTLSESGDYYLLCGGPALTVVDVALVSATAVASSGTHYWTFTVRNLTTSVNLKATATTTNGAAITADTSYAFGLDQNLTPAANAVIELQAVKIGAPASLTQLLVVVTYKVAI